MTIYTITGDWLDERGYLCDLSPRSLDVEIDANGMLYDADMAAPHVDRHITYAGDADGNGELRCWAAATFRPERGEMLKLWAAGWVYYG